MSKRDVSVWGVLQFAVVAVLVAGIGTYFTWFTHAASDTGSSCAVSAELVNSCHPWFGAAVGGDPKAASDKISQFTYLESALGRQLDLYHTYHSPGSNPLSSDEIHYAERANTYDYINWKPASNWADADGGDATVNTSIKQVADSIKSIAPHKIFLTVWHEPENDVSAFDNNSQKTACDDSSSFSSLKGSAGTPAQYIAMWQNVHNIFDSEGVTNVVWVMNYMGYKNWDCLIPDLWPGNNLVDWVTFDSYGSGSNPSWDSSVGRIYGVLEADSNATDDFDSKPWGSAEFNSCGGTDSAVSSYFASAKAALDANQYPRLKLYMVFDSADGPGGTADCLVDRDEAVLSAFKNFADDPIFTENGSPTDTTPPSTPGKLHTTTVTMSSVSIAWDTSTDNVGVAGYRVYRNGALIRTQSGTSYTDSGLSSDTSYTYSVEAYDAAGNDSGAAKLIVTTQKSASTSTGHQSGASTLSSSTGTQDLRQGNGTTTAVKVDGQTVSKNGQLNTTYLTNGKHTVTVTVRQPNGTTKTKTYTIDVDNKLSSWQKVRNTLLSPLRGKPTLMNVSFGIIVVFLLGAALYMITLLRLPRYVISRIQRLRKR